MSKERELLVNALERLNYINYEDDHLTNDLIQTIEKFLAKPEQTEQEPVAFLLSRKNSSYTELRKTAPQGADMYMHQITPLYTSPPKREPLTCEEISYGFRTNDAALDAESYWAGVKYAEKMCGITGDKK
tara:strand:- start:220 stop:609 length:390 start_codon:yes stop_codon:yes gene_type:complete